MTKPRSESKKLSQTAKSELESLAKQTYFGYHKYISSKQIEKGILCEEEAIKLYNDVFFEDNAKYLERKNKGLLTGECDLINSVRVTDIKTPWSIETWPGTSEDINPKDYEAQLRGYMYLYDVNSARLAYCLVDTPPELIGYENEELHLVSHIPIEKRVTILDFERSLEWESEMESTLKKCLDYYNDYLTKLKQK